MEMEETLLAGKSPVLRPAKAGFPTIPFILGSQALEKLGSYGLIPNMILYLTVEYGMGAAEAANVLFLWSAATNFSPLVGAFLADSYAGRFLVMGLGSSITLLGMLLLWTTTIFPQARPQCDKSSTHTCQTPTRPQLFLLYSSFALMSIGAGGARSSCLAFAADQLKPTSSGENIATSALERLFNWYYISIMIASFISLTCIVYIQTAVGWEVGFGVPVAIMALSVVLFFVASPFYIRVKSDSGLVAGFAQVIVAAFRNRHLQLTCDDWILYYHQRGSSPSAPSEKLRLLNKACATSNPQQDLTLAGTARNPWKLCTVQQVEDFKSLIKVLPIWSTAIVLSVAFGQSSFVVLQAKAMDRHTIFPAFKIPAGSFGVFMIISLAGFLFLYDNLILPVASKVWGKKVRPGPMRRMGGGLMISVFAMASLAIVECFRRKTANAETTTNMKMSAMWLVPYMVLGGVAEALNAVAQNEFYYTELPKTMSSVATALCGLAAAVASLASSWIIGAVDGFTGSWWGGDGGGASSWVSDDIDDGHLDYYYWLITGLCVANFLYFVGCSRSYGKCKGEENAEEEEEYRVMST